MALSTVSDIPAGSDRFRDLGRLAWALVAVALAASIAFALVVADHDAATTAGDRTSSPAVAVPQGSPDAIERRALAESAFDPATRAAVERGSIAAIDHAAATAPVAASFGRSTQPFVERGSITAIDHRAEVDG